MEAGRGTGLVGEGCGRVGRVGWQVLGEARGGGCVGRVVWLVLGRVV